MPAFLTLLLGFALLTACAKQAEEPQPSPQQKPEVTVREVEEKAQEALEAAKTYTLEQKEEYQKKAESKLQEFDKEIAKLKVKAEKTSAEARVKLKKQVEDLQKKQDVARTKLDKLKTAGKDAWEVLKKDVDATLTDIEDFLKNLLPPGE
jgi:outer membrane biogenesis lipoprotein LolB